MSFDDAEYQITCHEIIASEENGGTVDLWFDDGKRDRNVPDVTTSLSGLMELAGDCELRAHCELLGFAKLWIAWERDNVNFPAISLGKTFLNLSY